MQLRMTLAELGMPSIPSMFPVPKVQDAFDDDGQGQATGLRAARHRFLDELEWYAAALCQGRRRGTPY